MKFETFNYDNPYLNIGGSVEIDCRIADNFSIVENAFSDKLVILMHASAAALKDFESGGSTKNPHGMFFSPLRWTAWNNAYSFWMKHYRCG